MADARRMIVGMDGGGTTCRAALKIGDRRFDAQVPGSNATSDFDGTVASVKAAIAALAGSAGVAPVALLGAPTYMGLAGVTEKAVADRLRRVLGLASAVIEEDRRANVVDALGDAPGAVAVIGTGSFIARQRADAVDYQGGYGLALGDEASGAWLGREALAMALRAAEGMEPETAFTIGLRDAHGGRGGVIAFAARATSKAFATLAPQVLSAAESGDEAAMRLMARGIDYIERALAALGADPAEPLCLIGGIGPSYGPFLPDRWRAAQRPPQGEAPDGALTLADWVGRGWRP